MSYSVSLITPFRQVANVDLHDGGTGLPCGSGIAAEPSERASMGVAYNFVHLFAKCGFCLLSFHGMPAVKSIPALRAAVMRLGTERDPDDYRKPAAGNAGYALAVMLCWAIRHPQATWRVR